MRIMLPCFKSKLLEQIPHITHGFFTRNGGVSCGHYATLNVAEGKTDNPEHVAENRRRITDMLECNALQFNTQKHTTTVYHIDKSGPAQKGDALITQAARLLVGIQTADCMPLLIAHKTQKIVAAVHAGWKGALTGIIQATLDDLKTICDLNELVCAIGPCIAVENYEVGDDVYKLGHQEFFTPASPEKWHLDLRAFAQQILQDYGIVHIDNIQEDTYFYFSKNYDSILSQIINSIDILNRNLSIG